MSNTTQAFKNTQPNTQLNFENNNLQDNIGFYNLNMKKLSDMIKYLNENNRSFYENFELQEFIGDGITGVVYKGKSTNPNNKQTFSFKFNLKNNNRKDKYHEIYYHKMLHHTYICPILAFYKINHVQFFSVSEYGKYGDLSNLLEKYLKRKNISETFVNYLAKPILEALNYMHKLKLIHMDIKKANIIIDSDFNPKLIDFSSTFSFEKYAPNDIIKLPMLGTGRYMSPEILNKQEIEIKYGDKIDVYSLGVTLYNLLFGIFPYGLNAIQGNNYEQIKEHLKTAKLEFPSNCEVSENCKNFFKNTLAKDYKERYNVKEALEDPWIKGWDYIIEEKENIEISENFIIKLISDNIPEFNKYNR